MEDYNYKKKYEDALSRAREMCAMPIDKATMEYVFPELKENNDELVRKSIIAHLQKEYVLKQVDARIYDAWSAWLEKQKYTQKDVDDAYLEGITNAKKELEKSKPTPIDVDKMVSKYANTKESTTNSLPINCQIRAYRKGIYDALNFSLDIKKPITIGKRSAVSGKLKELIDNKDEKSLAETKEKMLAEIKWTDEDEKNLQGVIDEIQANKSNAPEYDLKTYDRFLSWLKLIKLRLQ